MRSQKSQIGKSMVLCIIPVHREPSGVVVATRTTHGCYTNTKLDNFLLFLHSPNKPNSTPTTISQTKSQLLQSQHSTMTYLTINNLLN